MFKAIILIIIFVIFIYVYSFLKIKKKKTKTNNINSVRDFRQNYSHLYENNRTIRRASQNSDYRSYVTKYNSSEDYREKRG